MTPQGKVVWSVCSRSEKTRSHTLVGHARVLWLHGLQPSVLANARIHWAVRLSHVSPREFPAASQEMSSFCTTSGNGSFDPLNKGCADSLQWHACSGPGGASAQTALQRSMLCTSPPIILADHSLWPLLSAGGGPVGMDVRAAALGSHAPSCILFWQGPRRARRAGRRRPRRAADAHGRRLRRRSGRAWGCAAL